MGAKTVPAIYVCIYVYYGITVKDLIRILMFYNSMFECSKNIYKQM